VFFVPFFMQSLFSNNPETAPTKRLVSERGTILTLSEKPS